MNFYQTSVILYVIVLRASYGMLIVQSLDFAFKIDFAVKNILCTVGSKKL